MNIIDHGLQVLHGIFIGGCKWIEQGLVFTCGQSAAFDAQFFHGIDNAKAVHAHADGAYNTGIAGIDFISSRGDIITARGSHIAYYGIEEGIRIFFTQAQDFVVDISCLYGCTARAVDAEYHAFGFFIFKSASQRAYDVVSAGCFTVSDRALQFNQGRVFFCHLCLVDIRFGKHEQNERDIGEDQEFEKDTPAPCTLLFFQAGLCQFGNYTSFPEMFLFSHWPLASCLLKLCWLLWDKNSYKSVMSSRQANGL